MTHSLRLLLALAVLGAAPTGSHAEQTAEERAPEPFRDRIGELAAAAPELATRVLELGLRAFENARQRGEVTRNRLTIIDYSMASTDRRLWTFDLETGERLFHELVAHGKRTGANHANYFSNRPGSRASSLGTFITRGTYRGRHGYSLKLDGLEPGINDLALQRAIVIHGARYVSDRFAEQHGRIGRSWGCPALRREVATALIDAIKDGSVLFAYYPDPEFLKQSTYLD